MNKKLRTIVGVALLAVAAVLAYFHFYGKAKIDEEIKKALATLPEGWSVQYTAIDYAVTSDTLTIEGLNMVAPADPPVTIKAAKMELAGVNTSTVQDLINGVESATEFKPLASSITTTDFSFAGSDTYTFTAERYVATNVSIKPMPKITGSLTNDQIVALLRSYSIEKEEMDGFKGTMTLMGASSPATFTAAKATILNHTDAKADRVEINGMALEAEMATGVPDMGDMKVKIDVGSTVISKMDYGSFLRQMVEGKAVANGWGVSYESLTYSDVSYDVGGLADFKVKEMAITDTLFEGEIPTAAKVSFSGLAFDIKEEEGKKFFADLGYETVPVFEGEGAYLFDPADKRMEVNNFRFNSDDVGTFLMSMQIKGLDLQKMYADTAADPEKANEIMQKFMENMELQAMNLRFDDKSLVGRIFAAAAKENDQSVEEAKQESIMGIMFLGGLMSQGAPEIMQLFESVGKFLEDPKSIELSLNPTEPVPLGERAAYVFAGKEPGEILTMLGLTLTVNQ